MFRNLISLFLILMIIFSNHTLNNTECMVFYFLGICYILGNLGFYFLDKYPNNPFWHFIIWGGYLWNEFPVTIFIMLSLLIYLILNK
jgi:hypothetical protein